MNNDPRPENCRFRLQEEKKPYPRSGCAGCHRSFVNGLGTSCHHGEPDRTPSPTPARTPPQLGSYPDAAIALKGSMRRIGIYYPVFLEFGADGITAEQAREAAHLLNQIAEYLENKI